MNKTVSQHLKTLNLGDLIRVEWFDASTGAALDYMGRIEFPVISWGIYLGVYGEPEHLVMAQSNWIRSEDFYDPDIVVIPLSWAEKVVKKTSKEVTKDFVNKLLRALFVGRVRSLRMGRQRFTLRRDIVRLLADLNIRRKTAK
jgi:hypothetical protein